MPRTQMHPLVKEYLENQANPPPPQEATPEVIETPAEPVAEIPDAPVPEPEASPSPEPTPELDTKPIEEPDYFLKLDSRNLYQELRRLENERADVKQVLSTYAGRSAAKKYDPQIRSLNAEIAELKATLARNELAQMDEKDVNEKLRTDAQFRRAYDTAQEEPEDVEYVNRWTSTFEDAFDVGLANGMSVQRVTDYRAAIANGYFGDVDEAPETAFARFQQTMLGEIAQQRQMVAQMQAKPEQPKSAAPKPVVAPKANPAIAEAKPDLSAPSHSPRGAAVRLSEYRQWSPLEKVRRFGSDLQAALNSGELVDDT